MPSRAAKIVQLAKLKQCLSECEAEDSNVDSSSSSSECRNTSGMEDIVSSPTQIQLKRRKVATSRKGKGRSGPRKNLIYDTDSESDENSSSNLNSEKQQNLSFKDFHQKANDSKKLFTSSTPKDHSTNIHPGGKKKVLIKGLIPHEHDDQILSKQSQISLKPRILCTPTSKSQISPDNPLIAKSKSPTNVKVSELQASQSTGSSSILGSPDLPEPLANPQREVTSTPNNPRPSPEIPVLHQASSSKDSNSISTTLHDASTSKDSNSISTTLHDASTSKDSNSVSSTLHTDSGFSSQGQRNTVNTSNPSAGGGQAPETADIFSACQQLNADWIKNQLRKRLKGKLAMYSYQKKGILLPEKRNDVVSVLIELELEDDELKRIHSHRFSAIAKAIVTHFSTEIETTYYIPRHKDKLGKVHKAKGKLYEKWINTRRQLEDINVIIKDNANGNSANEPVINIADLQEELTICKNNSVALPELIEVFKKTCHLRILLFGKGPKDIAKYITTYPALSKPDGHYLIEKDFDIVYPGKRNNFLTTWPEFGRKIFDHVFSIVARGDNKSLKINCSSLNIDLNIDGDEKKVINGLFLLPLLLPSFTVRRKWKPSRIEMCEAFYLCVDTIQEAQEKLAERSKRLQGHGFPELPTPVMVGDEYYVVIGDHFWQFDSALKAIDSCCKLYLLLKVEPQDCCYPFLFLKFFVYKINVESHMDYPALATLKNDIRL